MAKYRCTVNRNKWDKKHNYYNEWSEDVDVKYYSVNPIFITIEIILTMFTIILFNAGMIFICKYMSVPVGIKLIYLLAPLAVCTMLIIATVKLDKIRVALNSFITDKLIEEFTRISKQVFEREKSAMILFRGNSKNEHKELVRQYVERYISLKDFCERIKDVPANKQIYLFSLVESYRTYRKSIQIRCKNS